MDFREWPEFKNLCQRVQTTLEETGQLNVKEILEDMLKIFNKNLMEIPAGIIQHLKDMLVELLLKELNANGEKYVYMQEINVIILKMKKLK